MVLFRFQFPYMVVGLLLGNVVIDRKETFGFVITSSSSSSSSKGTIPTSFNNYHQYNGKDVSRVCLDAKAKNNKKKKKSGGASSAVGGGFGKVTATATKKKVVQDDYSSFPRLEPGVIDTLLPVTEDMIQQSDFMTEVYDRLDQIYGFDNFNGVNPPFTSTTSETTSTVETDDSPMSMNDLLSMDDDSDDASVGRAAASTTTAQSDFADLLSEIKSNTSGSAKASSGSNSDLNDLISAAVSGNDSMDADTTTAVEEPKITSSEPLDLFQLKPFSNINVLHLDPLILTIDDFFTEEECDKYVRFCTVPKKHTSAENMPMMISSKTVGKDKLSKSQRTSTTWYHHFKNVPELMAKASRLLGLDTIDRWEEPQTVRYRQSEKYTWHLDALAPSDDLGQKGGQRTATLLVYLADMGEDGGGATMFRDLGNSNEEGDFLKVQPKKGSALLFFPTAGGIPNVPFDIRTLHAGEAVSDDATNDKWIAQLWLRENNSYKATGPPGNSHAAASDAINAFCNEQQQQP
jgi:hypothetical protein